MNKQVDYIVQTIKTSNDLDDIFYHGFFEIYSECFCEAPYFQQFALERVRDDFSKMMQQGAFLCLRKNNGRIGAFIAGLPLKSHGALKDALKFTNNQIKINDLSSYWYHSEIGVVKRLRKKGYAKVLWDEMLCLIPSNYTKILARTHELNYDSLNMHEGFGFTRIPQSEHIIEDGDYDKPNHIPEDDTRVFLIRY